MKKNHTQNVILYLYLFTFSYLREKIILCVVFTKRMNNFVHLHSIQIVTNTLI